MEQPVESLPLIGQIAKLQLRPGDTLIVRSPRKLMKIEISKLYDALGVFLKRAGLSGVVPVLILDDGIELQVLDVQKIAESMSQGLPAALRRDRIEP